MYICVCKAVTDSQIKDAIASGACTRKQLFECFGVGGDCGKCNKQVKELLNGSLQQRLPVAAAQNQPLFNLLPLEVPA